MPLELGDSVYEGFNSVEEQLFLLNTEFLEDAELDDLQLHLLLELLLELDVSVSESLDELRVDFGLIDLSLIGNFFVSEEFCVHCNSLSKNSNSPFSVSDLAKNSCSGLTKFCAISSVV